MGMFDYLIVERELPGLTMEQVKAGGWQTKDTPAQSMERYRLTADGRLIHREVEYEIVPEDERPSCKDKPPEERDDIDKFCGMLGSREMGDKVVDWNGSLEFHGGPGESYLRFEAWFKDGVCVDIQRIHSAWDKEPK